MSIQFHRRDTRDGATFLIGTDDQTFVDRLKQAADGTTETPTPTDGDDDPGGPITRFTDAFSPLSMGVLEQLGLNGHEIANDIQTRVSELYRNEFPEFEPRFERKCEACDAEFDERVDACPNCGGDVREPDKAEKRRAAQLVESVNKEGQSLRDVAQGLEWAQWLTGVPVLVLRHEYVLGPDGDVARRTVDELIAGDAKRIVPVVDEHRRIGGYWWACPRCRHHDNYQPAMEPGRCETCDAVRREVYFAERGGGRGEDDIVAYYYDEEILTFPWPFPRLHGLDGLSPVHHVWLKQLIIDFQDRYAGAFYDPESDRLPNQFIVLHTTNPDRWEDRLTEARENAKDDQYDSPVFANEYSPQDNSTPEVQVVDAMPDELLGQNQELRETFKTDIRRATNISDLHDNDLSDAGGLNNEGLQLEVTDRPTATQMHDYQAGWLDELAKRLGIEDWQFGFIPATGPDAEDLRAEVEAGLQAEQGGLDARMVDGQVEIADGEFDPVEPAPQDAEGGLPMGQADDGGDGSSHDFGPELKQAAGDIGAVPDVLFEAHEHMVFPDLVDQRASDPFWDDDESMPEMVKAAIAEALRSGAISSISSHLPAGTTRANVRGFFAEKLDQPQGWSLRSLTEDYADRFDVADDQAAQAVRRQTKSILDTSREIAYEAQGDTDDRVFKWLNPVDDATTDASMEVLERTNPDYGGTPRSLDELEQIVAEARRKHFPGLTNAKWADSWQDRGTYVEHFE